MYRAVVLSLFLTTATALADMDMTRSVCNKFGPNLMHCCSNLPELHSMDPEPDVIECMEKTKASPDSSCEMAECIAKKLGYYGSDGKPDKDGFEKYMQKKLEMDSDFIGVFKEKCVNTDISKYGLPEMCDFIKIEICFYTFLYAEKCREWSDEGECKGIKDILQECKVE